MRLRPARLEPSRCGPRLLSNMFFDPEYVDMFDDMHLADDGEKAEPSNSTEDTSDSDKPISTLEQARLSTGLPRFQSCQKAPRVGKSSAR